MRKTSLLVLALFVAGFAFTLPTTDANSAKPPAKQITFSKNIAPIFFKNCAQCHRPGEAAPFSVLSYKDLRPWAKSIKEQVVKREMPPWHADASSAQFTNEARLSQTEIDAIAAWVDNGAPEGKPKDLPPLPQFRVGWEIGKPDLVIEMPQE